MSRNLAAAMIVALALTVSAGGCRGKDVRPRHDSEPVTSPTVAAVSGPVSFRVRLGAGERLIPLSPAPQGCPGVDTRVYLGSGRLVRFMSYATTCPTVDNSTLINGNHGAYRTLADVPADRRSGAVSVQTALGEATAFTQAYSEYTNSANHYTEPVAVITLTQPLTPTYQTVTVIAEKGTLPPEALATVLREQLLAP